MNLLEIDKARFGLLLELQDAEGEVTPQWEARWNAVETARDDKLEACCCVLKNFRAWIEMHKLEIQRLTARKQILENRAEQLENWVGGIIGPEGWEQGLHRLSWRKSKSVEVEDPEKLPLEMTRVKLEADKTALKKAIEGGATFEGVKLVEKQSLQIK
jgi:hypothetical protein